MPKVTNPVFIIGSYRGGTSIFFRLLSESKELWSMYREAKHIWRKFSPNGKDDHESSVMGENDLLEGSLEADRDYFENHYNYSAYNTYKLGYLSRVRKFRDWMPPLFNLMNCMVYAYKSLFAREYRIVDKTPPNCFKVSYLAKTFPDAKFIYLTRDGETNVSSLMNAWRDDRRFPFDKREYLTKDKKLNIEGYEGKVWKFAAPPGWDKYLDKSLAEACAFQWSETHRYASESFEKMDSSRYMQIKFEDLMANPNDMVAKVCEFIEIEYSDSMKKIVDNMPLVNTSSKPSSAKKKQNEEALSKVKEIIQPMQEKLGYKHSARRETGCTTL